jgi:hypothetical protein
MDGDAVEVLYLQQLAERLLEQLAGAADARIDRVSGARRILLMFR